MTSPAITPASPLHVVAANEFIRRQRRAREIVRNGGMMRGAAELRLRPWLAIACLCNAELPELVDILEDWRIMLVSGGATLAVTDGELRQLAAHDICPRERWMQEFATARDAAFDRTVTDRGEQARVAAHNLHRLFLALQFDVNGLHLPPYRPSAARPPLAQAA